MSKLIGLCGKARSGKDTVGDLLVERGFTKISFAAPIREFMASLLGLTLEELEEVKEQPSYLGKSPREMMQTLGTEWGRELVNPNIWIKTALRNLDGDVVVTDLRFDNEAEAILDEGGDVWKIIRDVDTPVAEHKSEGGVSDDMVAVEIHNTTLDSLPDQITQGLKYDAMVEMYDNLSPYSPSDPEYGSPVYMSDGLWINSRGEMYEG